MDLDFKMPDRVVNKKAQQLLWGYHAVGHVTGALNWGVTREELANEVLFQIWDKKRRGKRVYPRFIVIEAATSLKKKAIRKGFNFQYRYEKLPENLGELMVPWNDWRVSQCGY